MKYLIFGIVFFLASFNVQAQVSKESELFIELKILDSVFFERSFNQCDFTYLEEHIAADLKFYHDQVGVANRQSFFESIQQNICNGSGPKPIRKLVDGSLSVFPLYNNGELYGAIQTGVHQFYLREEGKEDVFTSSAKFTTVWLLENDTWLISEVLSYDHQETPAKPSTVPLKQLLEENQVPALGIGIIENGVLNQIEVYGTLDKQTAAPYNTLFKVASLTKPIFALTVLKLIDKGLLELDEPLHKYWIDPDVQADERHLQLTPKLVLTHQTGFPNWRYMTDSKQLAFQFDPGTQYQYSGEGFEYLRKAIENKLGKSIETLADEFIFQPSGMTDTHFWWDSSVDASRYAQNFDETGTQLETVKYYEANAAANLLTTVEDYGRFLTYVINGAELSESLFTTMQTPQVELKTNNYFGLGWEIFTEFGTDEIALVHSGKDPGVSTLAVIFPKSKNGYLIFMNGDNMFKIYEQLLKYRLYLGNELWNRQ